MLQPVTICPSAVSSAAPTLKSRVARLRARPRVAAASSSTPSWATSAAERRVDRQRLPLRLAAAVAAGAPLTRAALLPARRSASRPAPLRRIRATCAARRSGGPVRPGGRRPTAAPRSESLNDPLQQRGELAAHPPRHLHHLVVHERLRQHAGGRVGDARDAEHLDAPCGGATIASGTVDMPTASAPIVRRKRISAGVS